MTTRYVIATGEDTADATFYVHIEHPGSGLSDLVFETKAAGLDGLTAFKAGYDERNLVPRSGLIRGSASDWRLYRVTRSVEHVSD